MSPFLSHTRHQSKCLIASYFSHTSPSRPNARHPKHAPSSSAGHLRWPVRMCVSDDWHQGRALLCYRRCAGGDPSDPRKLVQNTGKNAIRALGRFMCLYLFFTYHLFYLFSLGKTREWRRFVGYQYINGKAGDIVDMKTYKLYDPPVSESRFDPSTHPQICRR